MAFDVFQNLSVLLGEGEGAFAFGGIGGVLWFFSFCYAFAAVVFVGDGGVVCG